MNPLAGGRLPRLFPEAAVAGGPSAHVAPTRRWFASKPRCETCSTRRSQTNIIVCLLLLGALLSYNWYDVLSRRAAMEPPTSVIAAIAMGEGRARPVPPPKVTPIEAPAPPAERAAAPVRAVRPAPPPRRAAPANHPRPPRDMEGLY